MKIIEDLGTWQTLRTAIPTSSALGFVPTMGNLHQGHASLIEACRQNNDCTVVSLFVNPTQFNQRADYTHYPRTLEDDLALLRSLKVDYCFMPNEETMYGDKYHYQVQENHITARMEGLHRPGHFNGVLSVIMKFFNIIQPNRAYFGEKDYQQYQVIQGMVNAFFMPIDIIPCPTVREASGLACSSRNQRLNPQQRQIAEQFAKIFQQKSQAIAQLRKELKHLPIEIEYLEEEQGRRFVAIIIDDIRLIDNYTL